jgi:hypothetical protein
MPRFEVNTPDGQRFEVNAPEGATLEDAFAYVKDNLWTPKEEVKKKSGLGAAFQRGAEQVASAGRTAFEAATKGDVEAAKAAQARQEDINRRLEEGGSLERLMQVYREKGLLPAAGELATQVPKAIAEQLPNILTTVGGAATGAAAGSVIPGVGTVIGGVAGALAPSLVQQYSGNIQRQLQAQQERGEPIDISSTKALGTAIPQAGLDVAATFIPLGAGLATKFFGPSVGKLLSSGGTEAAEKLAKETLLGTVARGTAVGIAAEVPTEVTQQMLERLQAGLDITSPDALQEYGETAFATALLGPIGIIGRVSNKAVAARQIAQAQQEAQQTNEIKQLEIETTDEQPAVLYVSPTGDISQSIDELNEITRLKQIQAQQQPTVTGATTTPEADQRAIQERMAEGFRQRPEIQKIEADYQAAMAKVDASKVAQSAFNTLFNEDVIKSFGVGPTATLFKDQEILNADISNPETADLVRSKLEAFSKKTSSQKVKDNINSYLDRSEFLTPKVIDDILNPPQELPPGAENLQQFAFIDQNGKVKSVIGTIVKKDNKQYIKYPKGQRELTNDVVVNPNPDQIRLLKLYKDRDNELKSKDDFKEWLMLYGVNPSERQEIGLEKNFVSPYFRKSGYGADELVMAAINDGILSESDFDFVGSTGGVESMREYIRRAMSNEFVPTPNNSITAINLRRLDDRIAQLEEQIKGAPEEVVAEQSIEEQQAPRYEVKQEDKNLLPSDKFIQEGLDLAIKMRDALDKMGLKNVGLRFEDYMSRYINGELKEVTGSYFENLIKVSLASTNVERTLNHEALHAMRDIGLFSDAEWKILSNKAKNQWIKKYDPDGSRYGDQPMEIRIEEAIADAFADYRTQPANIKSIFDKIIDLMDMIRNYFAGRGFRTVDDVFKRAETGGLDGQGTLRQWEELYEIKPIRKPLTDQEITNTSWSDQISNKLFANRELPDGTNVMVRLNLNGVVKRGDQKMHLTTIHEPFSQKKDGSFAITVKNAIGYDGVVTIRNVNFIINQKARADIFRGENKLPMGGAQGEIVQGVRDLEGTRIAFNPAREHLFVRVDDGRPVKYADELTVSDTDVFVRGNVEYYTPEDMPQPLDDLPTAANFEGISLSETKVKRGEIPAKKEQKEQKELFEVPTRAKVKAPLTGVDPAYADKLLKQFTAEKATIKQRFEGLKDNFFERMVTGMFDEFRAIKKYGMDNYMKVRLSKSIDGGLQGLLEYGHVFNDNGALNIVPGTKGLMKILEPLGTEVDQYQMWKALSRDANLPKDKRSFPQDLLDGRDQLTKGQLNGKSRKDIYEQAIKEENALNRSVLKVALDAGIIDKEGYDKFANDIYYIPFYKMMEGGEVDAVMQSSKLTGQYFSKTLKGGEKKTNDLMENVLLNWSHILSAAMKNQAAVSTLKTAADMGEAKVAKPMDGKYPPNSVKVMENGKTVHYELKDPDLVDAIATISYLGPKSMFLDVAKNFTNALRYGVTLSPAYKVRNLIRDSMSSAAVSPLSANLLDNVYKGLALSDKGNPTYMAALVGGGIFEMGVAHEGNQAKLIKRLVDKGTDIGTIIDTPEKVKSMLPKLLEWYNQQGNRFENANRLALYKKLREEGKTHLEASFQARDLMDFSLQGQFRAVKVISTVVPFFNARLQGLYKLGRDGITPTSRLIYNTFTGKESTDSDKQKGQRFMAMSGAIMLASMLLYSMYKDDEEFKQREDWDRDNFWWFKIGDTKFRIPKPFEIGALGTMAERTLEQISDDGVEGKVFFSRLNHILMDTFSLNPMPQMIKPLIDLYSNKDSFTGAPIEPAGMQNLSKQERVTNRTSGIAIALGGVSEAATKVLTFNPDAQGLSPIQIDYAIKAYLGWAGATAVSVADEAVEPFTEGTKVRPPIMDRLAMGFVKTEPETASKFMTDFYTNNARIQSALADMRHYAELGDAEKVGKILTEQGDDIALSKLYDKTSKQLAELRKQMRLIESNKDIPTEDKRLEMNRLRILMSKLTEQVESVRKDLKKQQ